MKVMKKISAILLSLCLLVPCFSMVVAAADGRISFTDPSTAVGEYVEVRCVLRSTSGNMGAVKVTLSYDESYLKFESGDSIEVGGAGELICAGTATSAEASFVAKFQALQEGTTKVEITSSEVSDANSATLTLDHGNSTITIAEGDPSKIEETDTESESESTAVAEDVQVDVDGVSYTLTDEFADADIPNGYARAQRTIEGVERQVVENETGMVCLVYMIDAEGSGEFFLYNEENNSYSPYAEIAISDVASIIVLNDTSQVSLPAQYKEAKLSLNEKEFPVWQDTENEGLYILHAMNNEGEAGYYQYDATEGTYQKMEFDVEENAAEESAVTTSSIVDKVLGFVEGHLLLVLLAVAVCAVLGLLILIILAVKLHNRNAELDELYDQYGIGEEAKEVVEEKPAKKEKKNKKKRQKEADFEEADFEEVDFEEAGFEEASFEEADFEEASFEETDFEEADFEETDFEEASFEEASFEEASFEEVALEEQFEEFKVTKRVDFAEEEFTGYTERMDFTIDDLDELLGEKKEKKLGHMEDDDTFKIDFIDLD